MFMISNNGGYIPSQPEHPDNITPQGAPQSPIQNKRAGMRLPANWKSMESATKGILKNSESAPESSAKIKKKVTFNVPEKTTTKADKFSQKILQPKDSVAVMAELEETMAALETDMAALRSDKEKERNIRDSEATAALDEDMAVLDEDMAALDKDMRLKQENELQNIQAQKKTDEARYWQIEQWKAVNAESERAKASQAKGDRSGIDNQMLPPEENAKLFSHIQDLNRITQRNNKPETFLQRFLGFFTGKKTVPEEKQVIDLFRNLKKSAESLADKGYTQYVDGNGKNCDLQTLIPDNIKNFLKTDYGKRSILNSHEIAKTIAPPLLSIINKNLGTIPDKKLSAGSNDRIPFRKFLSLNKQFVQLSDPKKPYDGKKMLSLISELVVEAEKSIKEKNKGT